MTFSHVSFISVPVDDIERAKTFYTEVIGLEPHTDETGAMGRWVILSVPDAETRIHLDQRPEGQGPPPRPVLVLVSTDLDGDCADLKEKGAEVLAEPSAAEWNPDMERAILRDSEGNAVLLTTP